MLIYRFILGGYYSIRYRTSKQNNQIMLRFVVLNTAMFQPQYADSFYSNEAIQQIEYVKTLIRLEFLFIWKKRIYGTQKTSCSGNHMLLWHSWFPDYIELLYWRELINEKIGDFLRFIFSISCSYSSKISVNNKIWW